MDDRTEHDTQPHPDPTQDPQHDRLAALERVIEDLFRAATLPDAEQQAAIADLVTGIEADPDLAATMQAAVTDLLASPCEAVEDRLLALAEASNHVSGTLLGLDDDLRSHIQSCPTCQALLADLEGPVDDFTASWGERAAAASTQTLDRYFQTRRMQYRDLAGTVMAGQEAMALMGSGGGPDAAVNDRDGGFWRRMLTDEDGVFTLIEYRSWLVEAEAFAIELSLVAAETGDPLTAHHTEWTVTVTLDGYPLAVQPSDENANEWALMDPLPAENLPRIVYDVSLVEPAPES